MSDKQLLEFAATAMQRAKHPNFANFTADENSVCLELGCRRGAITSYWSPHVDYGDALHLAKTLAISVIHSTDGEVMTMSHDASIMVTDTDTCRAIVRVAAGIGKSLP